jgi:hypothetical protein
LAAFTLSVGLKIESILIVWLIWMRLYCQSLLVHVRTVIGWHLWHKHCKL